MKTWKVLKGLTHVVAYVEVAENCKIYDTAYAALQLVLSDIRYAELITGCEDVRMEVDYGKPIRYFNRKTGEEVFTME